jgi:hypothetical protein
MRRSRARPQHAAAGSTIRENSQPDPGRKISIADATLPENLSRIDRTLIEKILACFDFFSTVI